MDKILIKSKFMKGIISKIIQHSIKKSKGIDTDVDLEQLEIDTIGDFVTIKLDGKILIRKEDFSYLIMKEL